MSLNPNTYTQCPYCPFKYKGDSKEVLDAMAGHINNKHKDKPTVKTGRDFIVKIPKTGLTGSGSEGYIADSEVINTYLGPIPAPEVEAMKPNPPSKEELDKIKRQQELKAQLDAKKKEYEQLQKELADNG